MNRMMENTLLQPLRSTGRYREEQVEQQVLRLLGTDSRAIWGQVLQKDRYAPDWIQEEALVCLLRIWLRTGAREEAWRVAEVLIERVGGFLNRQISVWHLSQHHAEECIRDVQDTLLLDLFQEGEKAEFYEVRFWLCLKRRFLNTVQKYRRIKEVEVHPNDYASTEQEGEDALLRMPDLKTLPPQMQVEIAEGLAQLKEQERAAFVLYHFEDWSQQEIADRLQVSERTVRNLLTRAERRLVEWRQDG